MDRKELDSILCSHMKWLYGDLCGEPAVLRFEDLRYAELNGVNLRGADIRGADLRGADLSDADLRCADLSSADLLGSDLNNANLQGADLRGANLTDADFAHAAIEGAKIDWPMVCPETGSFVAWKKAGEYIVKLEIPEDAKRSSATSRHCRASKAMVLEIQNLDGTKAYVPEVNSMRGWIYKRGEMVYPDSWDDNRWNERSHGIHFFMTRKEAVEW